MKIKQKKVWLVSACLVFAVCLYLQNNLVKKDVAKAEGTSLENLDELAMRKARFANSNWGASVQEGLSPNYYWQPETLQYNDSLSNNEAWRFTNSPAGNNNTEDISATHWSGDGKWVMYHSMHNTKAFANNGLVNYNGVSYQSIAAASASSLNAPPNSTYWKQIPHDASLPSWVSGKYYEKPSMIWMLANTDGSKLNPAKNSSSRSPNWIPYMSWNPSKSNEYLMGGSNFLGEGKNTNTLYRNTVAADGTITVSPILTTENASGRLRIKKSMSPDGSYVYFSDVNSDKAYVGSLNGTPALVTPTGYSRQLPFDYYWGQAPSSWSGYHDEFLAGAVNSEDGLWNYVMPENANGPWWRAKIIGTGTGKQPIHNIDHDQPYSWGGELEPVNTRTQSGAATDPWGNTEYVSHFTPDRWGHYGIFTKSTNSPYGASLLDFRTHNYWNAAKAFSGANLPWTQHHDWSAWSDWSTSSAQFTTSGYTTSITTQNFKNPTSQRIIASTHTRVNGDTQPYESLARPTQSPDGTKVMFNSTFLNSSDSDIQLFWTVAYYPYAPELKSAAKSSGNVHLTWDFNQGDNCSSDSQIADRSSAAPNLTNPRTYSTRGWPNETKDCAPSPREIKQFRVWQSDDNSSWTPLGTTNYNNCSGSNECGMWAEKNWNYDAAQANGTTKYYAITSVENSGLESRTLSNVWKVTTDTNGNITENTQQASYPSNPGGDSKFYQSKPDAPTNINFAYKLAPASSDGQYTLTWNAPTNKNLVRYYNIYAQDGSTPTATQQRRIASVPASSDYDNDGKFSYVDWLGNTDGSTKYLITSVDYFGNESGAANTSSDTTAPAVPSGLSVQ